MDALLGDLTRVKMSLEKRTATQADYAWLFELKKASMGGYIDEVYGWNDADQEVYFKRDFFPEEITIITIDGVDAGMHVVEKEERGYFLRRIEVHPDFQGRGIGSAVIQDILDRARSEEGRVRLMVFRINPAQQLYKRLGFEIVRETKTHYEMVWSNP